MLQILIMFVIFSFIIVADSTELRFGLQGSSLHTSFLIFIFHLPHSHIHPFLFQFLLLSFIFISSIPFSAPPLPNFLVYSLIQHFSKFVFYLTYFFILSLFPYLIIISVDVCALFLCSLYIFCISFFPNIFVSPYCHILILQLSCNSYSLSLLSKLFQHSYHYAKQFFFLDIYLFFSLF